MSKNETIPLGVAISIFIAMAIIIGILILILSLNDRAYTFLENQCISRGFAEVQVVDNVKTLVLKPGYEQGEKEAK